MEKINFKNIPDFAISLDYPVPSGKTLSDKKSIYKKANNINLSWTIESLKIRKIYFPKMKIFVPFQGYSIKQLNNFIDDISGHDFTGLCLPMRCYQDTAKLVSFLKHIKRIGIKTIHLLGTAKLDVMAITNYLSYHNYFKFISYDSCTIAHAARSNKIKLPYDLRSLNINKREGEIQEILAIEATQLKSITVSELSEVQNMSEKERRRWLTDFNYSSLMETKKALYNHSKSINTLVKYLSDRSLRRDAIQRIQKSLQEIELN